MMHSNNVIPEVPQDYELVWNDEFDGEKLDLTKWCTHPFMHDQPDLKLYSDERAIKVDNGCVNLISGREAADMYYTNTALTTSDTMVFKYGYLEICAKVPFGKPAFPSFWMQSSIHGAKAPDVMAEIDIFEHFSTVDPYIQTGIHKWYRSGGKEHFLCPEVGQAHFANKLIAQDWHKYGLLWTPEALRFFVDGQEYHHIDISESANFGEKEDGNMQPFHDYCYIIFNNYVMTNAFLRTDEERALKGAKPEDKFPIFYKIDYVRLYQKKGEKDIIELT